MRDFSRMLICILTITIMILFTSCNGPKEDSTKEKLVIWFHAYGSEDAEPAIELYKALYEAAHPDVSLDWIFVPGDYNQKILTTLASHQPDPDVFETTSGLQLSITNVRDGQLEQIDDLYPENPEDHFMETKLLEHTIDGHLYGVSTFGDGGVWYYRKSVLAEAGYDNPPATWMEMIEIAEAVSSNDVKGNFPHANGGTIFAGSLMYSSGAAQRRISPDGKDFVWDNNPDRAVEALKGLRIMAQSDSTLLSAPQPWWDPSALINGFTAMQWGGLWMFQRIEEALGDDFGVFGIPPFDSEPGSISVNHFGGWGLSINGFSDQKPAAREYLKWMWIDNTGNEIQLDWNNNAIGQKIPPRYVIKDIAFEEIPIYQDVRLRTAVNHNIEWNQPIDDNAYLWDSIMGAVWAEMANDVCHTDKDIRELFLKASANIQARLDEINAGS